MEQTLVYTPEHVCSRRITIVHEDGIVKKVTFVGGCAGNTQGVSLINLKKRNDVIASVCKVEHEEVEDEELEIRPDADGQTNMTYRDDLTTESGENPTEE